MSHPTAADPHAGPRPRPRARARRRGHTLIVRLDNAGDVLLAGPAVRAAAAGSDRVTLLCGPAGAAAGALLPGVDDVVCWEAPWVGFDPDPVDAASVEGLVARLRTARINAPPS